jgi:hypothetical protein
VVDGVGVVMTAFVEQVGQAGEQVGDLDAVGDPGFSGHDASFDGRSNIGATNSISGVIAIVKMPSVALRPSQAAIPGAMRRSRRNGH